MGTKKVSKNLIWRLLVMLIFSFTVVIPFKEPFVLKNVLLMILVFLFCVISFLLPYLYKKFLTEPISIRNLAWNLIEYLVFILIIVFMFRKDLSPLFISVIMSFFYFDVSLLLGNKYFRT